MKVLRWVGSVALLALWGCGGGSKSIVADQIMAPGLAETAAFHVDVATGKVTVTSQAGSASRAVFAGTSIGLTSSVLLDQPGSAGRKVLQVSLTNRSGEPIGQMSDGTVTGVRVTIGDITVAGAQGTVRSRTQVSTIAAANGAVGADGPVAQANCDAPYGLAYGDKGALYFVDLARNRVRKLAGGVISSIAGGGSATSVDGVGMAATFNMPYGIAFNPVDRSLVVAEFAGNCIRRIDASGRVTRIAGTGAAGSADGPGGTASFRNPAGVAVDASGTIFVSEYGGNRIRMITLVGADPALPASYTVSLLAGSAVAVAGAIDGVGDTARFNHPVGIALDTSGTLYVADRSNNRIRRVLRSGEVATIAGSGLLGYADGTGLTAAFREPFGIAWVDGALVVSELSGQSLRQIRSLDPTNPTPASASSWMVQLLSGQPLSAGMVDGTGAPVRFSNPAFLAASGNGQVMVSDVGNLRIRAVAPTSGFFPVGPLPAPGLSPTDPTEVRVWNADGQAPSSLRPYFRYPGVLAPSAEAAARPWVFVVPAGVQAFEFTVRVESDAVYGAPAASTYLLVWGSSDNLVSTEAGVPYTPGYTDGLAHRAYLQNPCDVACDSAGNVFFVSNNMVRRLSRDGVVSTVCSQFATGSGGSAAFGMASGIGAAGLAVSPDGKTVYVCNRPMHNVLRVSLEGSDPLSSASWSVNVIAGSMAGEAGRADGRGWEARFSGPKKCAWEDAGHTLYLTEYEGNRVRAIQFTGGDPRVSANWLTRTVAGDASATDGAAGTAIGPMGVSRLNGPDGIAMNPSGILFVADSQNQRVLQIDPWAGSSVFAGSTGAPGLLNGVGATAQFRNPTGIATDRAGYVFVTDESMLVRLISPNGMVSTIAGVVGGTALSPLYDGPGDASAFGCPSGLCVDSAGTIHVADSTCATIRTIQRVIQPSGP